MRKAFAASILVGTVGLALAGPALAQATYEVVDLGSSTGEWTLATDVNDAGLVVGTIADLSGDDHPFVWEAGVLTSLPLPENTGRAAASRVSQTGRIVGWAAPAGGFLPRALVWDDGVMTDIGTLGGVDAGALGVSPDGERVIGWARPTAGEIAGSIGFRAFAWNGTAMTDLGTLPVGYWSQGNDSNDAGQIVGQSGSKNDSEQAVLFDPEQGVIHLGTLGGLSSAARAINASGQVVGQSGTGIVANLRMVEHGFLWSDGAMTDLGVLPGDTVSWATDINDAGVVVGTSIENSGSPWRWRGFVWEGGQLRDLNDLIDPGSGWTVAWANAVNKNGWIVGRADRDGVSHAVLLVPRP